MNELVLIGLMVGVVVLILIIKKWQPLYITKKWVKNEQKINKEIKPSKLPKVTTKVPKVTTNQETIVLSGYLKQKDTYNLVIRGVERTPRYITIDTLCGDEKIELSVKIINPNGIEYKFKDASRDCIQNDIRNSVLYLAVNGNWNFIIQSKNNKEEGQYAVRINAHKLSIFLNDNT